LLREQNPPAGQRASPVPQVWDPTANGGQGAWVRVHGTNNAQHVTLTGRNVAPSVRMITTTPLASGASFTPDDIDLTAAPGVGLVSYIITADTPTQVEFYTGDGTNF